MGSTLNTAVGSSIQVINGGSPCNIFWQVGSSATLLGSSFEGNILASQSISLGDAVTVQGRLLASVGAVTCCQRYRQWLLVSGPMSDPCTWTARVCSPS